MEHPIDLSLSCPSQTLEQAFNLQEPLTREWPTLGATNTLTGDTSSYTDSDKLRGGYYTPPLLASWLCNWAIRKSTDRVLEPSCGDGVFLEAAAELLEAKGETSRSTIARQLKGIEINSYEAETARLRMVDGLTLTGTDSIHSGDFFSWWERERDQTFDVVVGNPPFVRYSNFPEEFRELAFDIMKRVGLKANRLTNIWVPFVVGAAESLSDGGRLAMVLPAELLQVTYAGQLRGYLADRFSSIDIITCNQLLFKRVQQEVVLLLADEARPMVLKGQPCRITLSEFNSVEEIIGRSPQAILANAQPKTVLHESEKWLKFLLTPTEIALMRELRESKSITNLSQHACVDVGVVTGRNDFFVLGKEHLEQIGLSEYTIPLISRSKQLQGVRLNGTDWGNLDADGDRVHLLHLAPLNGHRLAESLATYIQEGESDGINNGHKCSARSPWYAVPSVWEPHGFLLRQIYDFPRIVLNGAGATCTDTIHRLTCKGNPEEFIPSTYTYLTGASAEIEGRSYGGGMLALEPSEAERLLVPAQLTHAVPIEECDKYVRSGRLAVLLEENSLRVLVDGIGLSRSECTLLKAIWTKMSERRLRRGRRRSSNP